MSTATLMQAGYEVGVAVNAMVLVWLGATREGATWQNLPSCQRYAEIHIDAALRILEEP